MKDLFIQNIGVLLSALATGLGGWFFGRKKANAEVKQAEATAQQAEAAAQAAQIENAAKLLEYYKNLVDDLGTRQERAIEKLQQSEVEKQEVIKKFTEATETIHQLERKVEILTEELKKYKELSGKA